MRAPLHAWVALLSAASTSAASAEPADWLAVRASDGCAADAGVLIARVTESMLGERDPELYAELTVTAHGPAFEAHVQIWKRAELIGKKTLGARECEETLDAAVLVIAMAVGAEPAAAAPSTPAPSAAPRSTRAAEVAFPSSTPPAAHVRVAHDALDSGTLTSTSDHAATEPSWRVSLMAGGDSATLPAATAYVGLGAALALSSFELRSSARYGLPHLHEERETITVDVRREFGSLELAACHLSGARSKIGACGGAELGAVRTVRELRAGDREPTSRGVLDPRLSVVLSAVGALRGGTIEPQLELGAGFVALGRRDDASRWVLRGGVGAAVQF